MEYTGALLGMKLFIRLFVGFFLLELALYGIAAVSHAYHPVVYFLIIPSILLGMAIGGVHSAGFLSFLVGLAATALLYAALALLCIFVAQKLRRRGKVSAGQTSNC
jgi:hypothetical protein